MCCEKGEEGKSLYQALPDHIAVNGDPKSLTASSMIRSHSVSGDLHGVPPDPVAADILRKEPEQETFVRLRITPNGMALCFPELVIMFDFFKTWILSSLNVFFPILWLSSVQYRTDLE